MIAREVRVEGVFRKTKHLARRAARAPPLSPSPLIPPNIFYKRSKQQSGNSSTAPTAATTPGTTATTNPGTNPRTTIEKVSNHQGINMILNNIDWGGW